MCNLTSMYSLVDELRYYRFLRLEEKYRYDFVSIDFMNKDFNHVFVFRTIKSGEGKNNVLVDFIYKDNIDVFAAKRHGDCNFYLLEGKDILKRGEILITDNIKIKVTKNEISYTFYAIFSKQTYRYNSRESKKCVVYPLWYDAKCLLFTKYYEKQINMNNVVLPYIFDLQQRYLFESDRYNRISGQQVWLRNINKSTTWGEIEEKIIFEQSQVEDELKQISRKIYGYRFYPELVPIEE